MWNIYEVHGDKQIFSGKKRMENWIKPVKRLTIKKIHGFNLKINPVNLIDLKIL